MQLNHKKAGVDKKKWGEVSAAAEAQLYRLESASAMVAEISDYGGIITSIKLPGAAVPNSSVVIGSPCLGDYLAGHPYLGCIVGRYANRIRGGAFCLDGEAYQLPINNAPNHLHGGYRGFDKQVWRGEGFIENGAACLRLFYRSQHLEEGYPGNLDVVVTYRLLDNTLRIEYEATTDAATVVNLTNHTYFNLAGVVDQNILDHELQVEADNFLAIDNECIPRSQVSVVGTPLDFRDFRVIGSDIQSPDEQIVFASGYDHNFVLRNSHGEQRAVARLRHPASSRLLEVVTTKPGLQLYTGNFLAGAFNKTGYGMSQKHQGLCLETQSFPDSPNRQDFSDVVLRPGDRYWSVTEYRFSNY